MSNPKPMLAWERVFPAKGQTDTNMSRAKVKGGWIFSMGKTALALCFIPDPSHEWASGEPVPTGQPQPRVLTETPTPLPTPKAPPAPMPPVRPPQPPQRVMEDHIPSEADALPDVHPDPRKRAQRVDPDGIVVDTDQSWFSESEKRQVDPEVNKRLMAQVRAQQEAAQPPAQPTGNEIIEEVSDPLAAPQAAPTETAPADALFEQEEGDQSTGTFIEGRVVSEEAAKDLMSQFNEFAELIAESNPNHRTKERRRLRKLKEALDSHLG